MIVLRLVGTRYMIVLYADTYGRPPKCNTTKPSLMKEGIGFGSSLYRFTWFGVPCSDFCLLVWV